MNYNPNKRLSLFKIHWIVLAVLAYSLAMALSNYIFIQPMVKKYYKLQLQKKELNRIYSYFSPVLADSTLQYLEKEINKSDSEKLTFEAQPIETKDFVKVFVELNGIARKTNITLNSMTPGKNNNLFFRTFNKRIINIIFNSTYPQFLNFLNALEKSKYPLFIDSYNISKNSTNNYIISMKIFTIIK